MVSRSFSPRINFVPAILMALVYFALATAAIGLTRLSNNVALMWLANAPLIVALCLRPANERLSLILAGAIGSFAASQTSSPYSLIAPLFVTANVGEAVIAWILIDRMGLSDKLFATTRSIPQFGLAAALVAPAISGLVAAFGLWVIRDASPMMTWSNWFIGHGLGSLIAAPVALLVMRAPHYWAEIRRTGQPMVALGLITLTIAVCLLVFCQSRLPLLFLPILPVIMATFALRFTGAATGVFVVAIIGAILTLSGHGPVELIAGTDALRLQFFQFYLGILFLITLPVSTMLAKQDRLVSALAESEGRYRMVADHASDIMLTLDPDGSIRFASPSVRDIAHVEPERLIGRNVFDLVVPEDRARVVATHVAAVANPDQALVIEFRANRADGVTRWFQTTTRAVADDGGIVRAVVAVTRDLSPQKVKEAELLRMANTDPLTGLLNRNAFRERAEEAVDAADLDGAPTMALLDLDHFKQVNDTYGHAAGDAALLVFADLLRANLRAGDAVGRIGGEEFAVLFDGGDQRTALATCERLRQALQATSIPAEDGEFQITVSIGLTDFAPGEAMDAALQRCDHALYAAKRAGRNRTMVVA